MKSILGILLLVLTINAFGQQSAISVNTNFFFTQQPVFKAGYSYYPDSTNCTLGLIGEFGRFSHASTDYKASTMDAESTIGWGLIPEMRFYPMGQNEPMGLFLSSFLGYRRQKQTVQDGVTVTSNGYDILEPRLESISSQSIRFGTGVGYRSGCHANLLHLEVHAGTYWFDLIEEENLATLTPDQALLRRFRMEVNLVAVF